jgi:FAD/FMN-containing dehydrogenase
MTTGIATLEGARAEVSDEALDDLRMAIWGDVLTPDEPGYAAIRPPYNAMHPGEPAIVVRASGIADVLDAVNFAREHELLVAVRGGGHSVAGLSSVDGGMLIDLSPMNGVVVDPEAQTVTAQGGALWGDVDRETQAFGLITPGGIVSETGVAGLTLGGGEGWVRRKYGLSCDSLLSAQLVCADGEVRTASDDVNPDLYWAIRGGGGNFGIATTMTFRLHPHGPMNAFAGVFYPADQAADVWRKYRDWAATAPNEVTSLTGCTTLPASEHTPPEIHDTPFVVVGGLYAGDPDEGMKVLQPLREFGTPLADISDILPFRGVQQAFDEFFQRGTLRSYWKSTFLNELADEVIDILAPRAQNRPSKRTFVVILLMGGAINEVGAEDTAYPEREANWMVSIDGNWEDPAEHDKVVSWVRDTWSRVYERGTGSVYLNFTGIADEDADVGVDSGHSNLDRLREIKKKYDPDNFFRLNNNIAPG